MPHPFHPPFVAFYGFYLGFAALYLYSTLLSSPLFPLTPLLSHLLSFHSSSSVSELHTKVEELKLNNEYQLKLKEMTYSEKVRCRGRAA